MPPAPNLGAWIWDKKQEIITIQDRRHQWSTRPAHSPGRQWLSLDFEGLGWTDGRTDTLCENMITTGRDCGRPRGSIIAPDVYCIFLLHMLKKICAVLQESAFVIVTDVNGGGGVNLTFAPFTLDTPLHTGQAAGASLHSFYGHYEQLSLLFFLIFLCLEKHSEPKSHLPQIGR